MFYKFNENEIIRNTIKFYPRCNFKGFREAWDEEAKLFYNNQHWGLETNANYGEIDLYDFAGSLSNSIYSIVPKTSNYFIGDNVGLAEYTASSYGTQFTQSFPITFKINIDVIQPGNNQEYINSVVNIFNLYYKNTVSGSFCDNIIDNLNNLEKTIINIPRMFYGSSINKGSVNIKSFVQADYSISGQLTDVGKNGILIDSGSNKVSGFCFYNHGIILLFEDTIPGAGITVNYPWDSTIPSWNRNLFTGAYDSECDLYPFELQFEGVNYLNTLTMFAHAPINNLNHSNNPTYVRKTNNINTSTSSFHFIENAGQEIKNIVYNNLTDQTASFEKETYINKIGIYDKEKKLIAVSKLATPVRKRQKDGYTFKIKKDLL
jgi:hypothetical protein